MRQTKSYNCAVFAITFLLKLKNIFFTSFDMIEQQINCTEEDGTSPLSIMNYFHERGLSPIPVEGDLSKLPLLVNYQYEEVGHYGVIIHINEGLLWIYDPWTGDIQMMREKDFRNVWYSKRYGKEWGLYLND